MSINGYHLASYLLDLMQIDGMLVGIFYLGVRRLETIFAICEI